MEPEIKRAFVVVLGQVRAMEHDLDIAGNGQVHVLKLERWDAGAVSLHSDGSWDLQDGHKG